MTFLESLSEEKRLAARIHEITKDHPLRELEADYLAEAVLESQGRGGIVTNRERALERYVAIVDWLECTGRISPAERSELLALPRRWA